MSTLLLKLLLLPPDLLRSHVLGYADLAREMGAAYVCTLKSRWMLYMLSAVFGFLACLLGGMALLLWGAISLDAAPHVWLLTALPLGLFLLSAWCWWWGRSFRYEPFLKMFQAQIQLDILAVQEANSA